VIEATKIGGCRSDRLSAEKLSSGNFGLCQQYRHKAADRGDAESWSQSELSGHRSYDLWPLDLWQPILNIAT